MDPKPQDDTPQADALQDAPRPDFPAVVALPSAKELPLRAPVRIKDLPESERPREKMIEHGPSALTDPELLAIFFGTGVPGMNAVDLGRMLMRKYETLTGVCRRTYPELRDHKGIGPAKAMNLAAAFELGRRLAKEEYNSKPLDTPKAIYELLSPQMRGLAKECLRVLLLTTRFTLLANEEIHVGTVNETLAHPRDILRPVISHGAYAFVIAHNHPSGDPTPSAADGAFTRRLREASDLLQVRLMDHIIIGQPGKANPNGYFSFREAGMF